MKIGQPVEMTADLYGSKVVYHGKVMGLSAGTGSAFFIIAGAKRNGQLD